MGLADTISTKDTASVMDADDVVNNDDDDDAYDDESRKDASEPLSSAASFSPTEAVLEKWKKILKFPKIVPQANPSGTAVRFGPPVKKPLRKWADSAVAKDFAALRREDCLHVPFEAAYKKNTDHWKTATFTANAAGAAAHASLSAASALEGVFSDLKAAFADDPIWSDWLSKKAEKAKSTVFAPLEDSVVCCAGIYGHATTQIRNSVIKEADKSIQSVLKSKPPADGYFFGDPSDAIQSQMSYAFMSSAVNSKSTASRDRPANQPRSFTHPKKKLPPPPASSPSSAPKTSGNNYGRAFRGGRGSRKQ